MKKFAILLCAIGVCCALPQYRSGGSSQYGRTQSGYSAGSISSSGRSSGSYGIARTGNQYGRQRSSNDLSEPAQYEFKYDVNEPEYNVEFGHREQRDGEDTRGAYYVLLPDGRRQLVEYTADADGFHPRISYQEGGASGNYQSGGYGASTGRNGGYQSNSGY